METSFTAEQLKNPQFAEAARLLKDCVHYGFCSAVCPTYVLLGDENDSPRGRIDLIKAMLERGGEPDAKTVKHLDQCLSCNSCMSTCAARVDYMHLADIARSYIENNFRRKLFDRWLRDLIAGVLPRPNKFRLALRAAMLGKLVGPLLPISMRAMLALVPERIPAQVNLRPFYTAKGSRRMRVALLAGCVQQVLGQHINAATIRLLTRHGCDVVVTPGTECCGALTLHMGREQQAKNDAGACIRAWRSEMDKTDGLDAIVVNASGCGTAVKDYGHLMAGEPEEVDARRVASIAVDVSELLDKLHIRPAGSAAGIRIAYHDACSLQHAQKVTEPPRRLLKQAGFVVADVPERHFCCGSAGTYNLLQPEIAKRLGMRKAGHIESTGSTLVATGNIGCITQLSHHTSVPILHTVELLDWATGGPMPDRLRGLALPRESPEPDGSDKQPGANALW
jgi:glycolate oxidase iron-sulfur subunit